LLFSQDGIISRVQLHFMVTPSNTTSQLRSS